MIKKYNDFNSTEYLNRERESMERELRARKTKKNNVRYDLDINLPLIKREILHTFVQDYDYTLSIGNRIESLYGSDESIFHIEFENETLGRVRIFKPKDTFDKGYYEVNGDYYETSSQEVREFYHLLNQEIKGKPLVVKESVRELMKGKSEEEIKQLK